MAATFDLPLVLVSYAISVFGSYTGLVLAGKVTDLRRGTDRLWLIGAAVVFGGAAIWAMHFIGMLAYKTSMPVHYDATLTLASLSIAILFTGIGLYMVIRQQRMKVSTLLAAGVVMGLGVAAMHYTGMAAMVMAAEMHHNSVIVALSIVIAIVASIAALWIAFTVRTMWQKVISALVMGIAVCGMHYTAMFGFIAWHDSRVVAASHSVITTNELAGYVVLGTMALLAAALFASFTIAFNSTSTAER